MQSSASSHKIKCPKCGEILRFKPEQAGKRVKCPKCNHILRLPAKTQPLIDVNAKDAPSQQDADSAATVEINLAQHKKSETAASQKPKAKQADAENKKEPGKDASDPSKTKGDASSDDASTQEVDLSKFEDEAKPQKKSTPGKGSPQVKPRKSQPSVDLSAMEEEEVPRASMTAIISTIIGGIFVLLLAVGGIGALFWISQSDILSDKDQIAKDKDNGKDDNDRRKEDFGTSKDQSGKTDKTTEEKDKTKTKTDAGSKTGKPPKDGKPKKDGGKKPPRKGDPFGAELLPPPRIAKGPPPKTNLTRRPEKLADLVGNWRGVNSDSTVAIRPTGEAIVSLILPPDKNLDRFVFTRCKIQKQKKDFYALFDVGNKKTRWIIKLNDVGDHMELYEVRLKISLEFERPKRPQS